MQARKISSGKWNSWGPWRLQYLPHAGSPASAPWACTLYTSAKWERSATKVLLGRLAS